MDATENLNNQKLKNHDQSPTTDVLTTDTNELSRQDPSFLQTVLQQPMASHWTGATCTYRPYILPALSRRSSEYRRVKNFFKLTTRDLFVRSIRRVENPFLLGQYLLRKEGMIRSNIAFRERLLFHGTKIENIDGICRMNFDWRRNGESRGHKFGHGVCFSPEVSFASQFGHNAMILARVLVGKTIVGNSDTVIPPRHFDTTRNSNGTVLVKYEDAEYYPEYVIYYWKKKYSFLQKVRMFLKSRN